MKHAKLIVASALAAAAWCGATQAQSSVYIVEYGTSSTGSTPSLEGWSAYPKHPGSAGVAVTGYWDNGIWYERTDPVMVSRDGAVRYIYPETARTVPPPTAVYIQSGTTYGPYPSESKTVRGYR